MAYCPYFIIIHYHITMSFFETLTVGIVAGITAIVLVALYNATKDKLLSVLSIFGLSKYFSKTVKNVSVPNYSSVCSPMSQNGDLNKNSKADEKKKEEDEYNNILKELEDNGEKVILIQHK